MKIFICMIFLLSSFTPIYAMMPKNCKMFMKNKNCLPRALSKVSQVEQGALYKHYKRKSSDTGNEYLYKVICISHCSEDIDKLLVTYQALYPTPGLSGVFTRPYAMFIENVENNGEIVPRFEKIEHTSMKNWIAAYGKPKK